MACQPSWLLTMGFRSSGLPGLAGFAGDRDVQLCLAGDGEVGLAGVPGVEQRRADRAGDPGGGQVRGALFQQRVQRAG